MKTRNKKATSIKVAFSISTLPHQDSNLEKRYQKPVCYHYTMGHSVKEGQIYASLGNFVGHASSEFH